MTEIWNCGRDCGAFENCMFILGCHSRLSGIPRLVWITRKDSGQAGMTD